MAKARAALAILLILKAASALAADADPRKMVFEPVEIHPPPTERVVLENGIVVYLLEDHELPLIRLQAFIRTGQIYDPPDRIGLAAITGSVMRTGGTRTVSGDALDEELEFMAAQLNSMIADDAGFASLDILSKDLDRGIALWAGMLMHPAFAEDKLDLAKKQALEGIRRRNDNPSGIASREFMKAVYGENHPLARESTPETITRITREDLIAFHASYYYPGAVIVAASGDFIKAELLSMLSEAFAGWAPGKSDLTGLPSLSVELTPSVSLVEKDITQTHLRIGHLGIRRDHPDYFAARLLDDVLGSGGFRSRLFREVRTRLGLAYSVGGVFTPGNLERGIFVTYSETKAESTYQAIAAIRSELSRIRDELITEEELRLAKDAFLNSFVFSFAEAGQIANRQASLEYYGLPPDYLERFRDSVIAVTRETIRRVAREQIHPEALTIVMVGRPQRFGRPLSDFGEVKTLRLEPFREPVPETRSAPLGTPSRGE